MGCSENSGWSMCQPRIGKVCWKLSTSNPYVRYKVTSYIQHISRCCTKPSKILKNLLAMSRTYATCAPLPKDRRRNSLSKNILQIQSREVQALPYWENWNQSRTSFERQQSRRVWGNRFLICMQDFRMRDTISTANKLHLSYKLYLSLSHCKCVVEPVQNESLCTIFL